MAKTQNRHKEEPLKPIVPNNENLLHQAESQEPRLVSICIKNKQRLAECIKKGVTVDSFMTPVCKVIYGILAEHYDNYGASMSRQAFSDEADKRWKDAEIGRWREEFDHIWGLPTSDGDFPSLMDDMEGRHLQIQAYTVCQTYFDPLLNQTSGQKNLVEKFQRHVSRIRKHNDLAWTTSSTLSENMGPVWKEIISRRDNPSQFHGIMSGFKCMDQVFNGFNRGKYIVILAIEGGGKTTFMLNKAHNMCSSGLNIGYVTVESDSETATKRLLTIHSKVNYNRIALGGNGDHGLNDYTISQLSKGRDDLEGGFGDRFHWIQALQGTPQSMILEELDRKLAYTKLDVIFVDYLDVIGSSVRYPDRPDLELADVSAGFQNYGNNHNILVITAQQMKTEKVRELTGKSGNPKHKVTGDNFNVGVGDVAGSKKISGAADYIFALFVDPNCVGRMYVQTVKARNSRSKDKFALAYDPDSGRVEDILPSAGDYENIANDIADNPKFQTASFEQPPGAGQVQSAQDYATGKPAATAPEWDMLDAGVDFFLGE